MPYLNQNTRRNILVIAGNGLTISFLQHHKGLPSSQSPLSLKVPTPDNPSEDLIDNFWELQTVLNDINAQFPGISDFEKIERIVNIPENSPIILKVKSKIYNYMKQRGIDLEFIIQNRIINTKQELYISLEYF